MEAFLKNTEVLFPFLVGRLKTYREVVNEKASNAFPSLVGRLKTRTPRLLQGSHGEAGFHSL